MEILDWNRIETLLPGLDVVEAIAEGFRRYSEGLAVVPPVGELQFAEPPGDVHIKYGYLRGGRYYVVKIASGFYDNPQLGLSSCMGLMLLFCQRTGVPEALLLDDGRLTDIRTAAAGAVAAKRLAPTGVTRIGIVGTGIQARVQARYLKEVLPTRDLIAWGRSEENLTAYLDEMKAAGFDVTAARSPREVAETSQLIVTTTPAREPLLHADWIAPGTHITAVGSDIPEKQELDVGILAKADCVIADSLSQCQHRGEIHKARAAGVALDDRLVALGAALTDPSMGRQRPEDITVADLTGVAVQDLQIAVAVLEAHRSGSAQV